MKEFLAIYIGTKASLEQSKWLEFGDEARKAQRAAALKAWSAWNETHAASIVDAGGWLGATTRASPKGVEASRNHMTGYVVVRADSAEAAAKLFESHPHFVMFPGEAVEIMERLPIPAN